MSKNVGRFTAGSQGVLWGYGQGEWVRYSDYESLQSQLEQLRAENEGLQQRIKHMEQDAREDARDAAAEARWQERQGDEYGNY